MGGGDVKVRRDKSAGQDAQDGRIIAHMFCFVKGGWSRGLEIRGGFAKGLA